MSLLQGLVTQLLLETLTVSQHVAPHRAAWPSGVVMDLEVRHRVDPRAEGGWLASFLKCQINLSIILRSSEPLILLWALLPAFPSFSLTPSRNVCAQQSGKQETTRSIMLGNIHYCSRCLSVTMSKALGMRKKVISCPRGHTDQVDPASESSSGGLHSSVEAQQKPWLICWDFL